MRSFILILSLFSLFSFGEESIFAPPRTPSSKSHLLLFDIRQKMAYPVLEKKADRVYIRYSKPFRRWVFTKTNSKGDFADPLEAFAPGSILRGEEIGGATGTRFVLEKNGEWTEVPSSTPLRHKVWTSKNPKGYHVWFISGEEK